MYIYYNKDRDRGDSISNDDINIFKDVPRIKNNRN
jgi:hypothetical protein